MDTRGSPPAAVCEGGTTSPEKMEEGGKAPALSIITSLDQVRRGGDIRVRETTLNCKNSLQPSKPLDQLFIIGPRVNLIKNEHK